MSIYSERQAELGHCGRKLEIPQNVGFLSRCVGRKAGPRGTKDQADRLIDVEKTIHYIEKL